MLVLDTPKLTNARSKVSFVSVTFDETVKLFPLTLYPEITMVFAPPSMVIALPGVGKAEAKAMV